MSRPGLGSFAEVVRVQLSSDSIRNPPQRTLTIFGSLGSRDPCFGGKVNPALGAMLTSVDALSSSFTPLWGSSC